MMDKERPKMGEWLLIKNEATKYRHDMPALDTKHKRNHHRVEWGQKYKGWCPEPFQAMYIGYRQKRNGIYHTSGWNEEWEQHFDTTGSVEVWVFVTNERSKPIEVFPKDITS
jgi:hypothetical protein